MSYILQVKCISKKILFKRFIIYTLTTIIINFIMKRNIWYKIESNHSLHDSLEERWGSSQWTLNIFFHSYVSSNTNDELFSFIYLCFPFIDFISLDQTKNKNIMKYKSTFCILYCKEQPKHTSKERRLKEYEIQKYFFVYIYVQIYNKKMIKF